jgi:hypothetical protein
MPKLITVGGCEYHKVTHTSTKRIYDRPSEKRVYRNWREIEVEVTSWAGPKKDRALSDLFKRTMNGYRIIWKASNRDKTTFDALIDRIRGGDAHAERIEDVTCSSDIDYDYRNHETFYDRYDFSMCRRG